MAKIVVRYVEQPTHNSVIETDTYSGPEFRFSPEQFGVIIFKGNNMFAYYPNRVLIDIKIKDC